MGKHELIKLTTTQTWGEANTFPLIVYTLCLAMGWTPKCHFVPRVLKFPKLQLLRFWGPITLCENLRLRWGLKQSCSLSQELFNGKSQTTYKKGNWGASWLLVVRNQIDNLTPSPPFGHNLCFKCPNGPSKPILNI